MAAGDNDIVRRGYLSVVRNPKEGMLGSLTTSMSSKRFWLVLRKETPGGGRSRLEFYRSEEQSNEPVRVIPLDQIREVHRSERKKASFEVHLQEEVSQFTCSSMADMDDWMRDIARFQGGRGSTSSFNGELPDNTVNGQAVYEDLPEDEVFHVRVRKSNSLMFSGPCQLEILKDFDRNIFHIAILTDEEHRRLVVKWQIDHIRQYGSNNTAFKFQSGSKSPTGVDWFIIDTELGDAPKVHRSVDYWAKHIVDQVRNTSGRLPPKRSHSMATSNGPPMPPRTGGRPVASPTGSLPRSVYAPLNVGTMQSASVYDNPDKVKKRASGTPSTSSGAIYQPLRQSEINGTNESTYQDLTHRGPEATGNKNLPPRQSRNALSGPNGLYMDLKPETRDSPDQPQYMGLKDARP